MMGHSVELLDTIAQLVKADYPPMGGYKYEFEKPIPGTRMFPDILVRDSSEAIVCAVEIGYTRPEKITAYRVDHNIADVRWYAKDGTLHTSHVVESVVRVRQERLKAPKELQFWVFSYWGDVCHDCFAEEGVDALMSRAHPEDDDESESKMAELDAAVEALYALPEEELWKRIYALPEDELEERREEASREVLSLAFSNGDRHGVLSFCDRCGGAWLRDDEEMASGFCFNFDEFLVFYHRKQREDRNSSYPQGLIPQARRVEWSELSTIALEEYGVDLDYGSLARFGA